MGTILEFRVTNCERREEASSKRTLGEIIIFPGVRIERHGLTNEYRKVTTLSDQRRPAQNQGAEGAG